MMIFCISYFRESTLGVQTEEFYVYRVAQKGGREVQILMRKGNHPYRCKVKIAYPRSNVALKKFRSRILCLVIKVLQWQ